MAALLQKTASSLVAAKASKAPRVSRAAVVVRASSQEVVSSSHALSLGSILEANLAWSRSQGAAFLPVRYPTLAVPFAPLYLFPSPAARLC
jgi:hypothetical protein